MLSKLFISSEVEFVFFFFFLDKKQRLLHCKGLRLPSETVFIHVPGSACLCPVSETVISAVLLIGLASCQAASRRTGQHCTPPPLPPAGSLVSALDTKTNRLCPLAPYSTPGWRGGYWGRGEGSKYPSYVNNQDYLAAHLIFCNLTAAKWGLPASGGPIVP